MSKEEDSIIDKKKKSGALLFVSGIAVIVLGRFVIGLISSSSCEHDPHGYCGFGFFIRYLIILAFGILLIAFGIGNSLSARRAKKRFKEVSRTSSSPKTSVAKNYFEWFFISLLIVAIIVAIPMTFIYISSPSNNGDGIVVVDVLIVISLILLMNKALGARKK